MCGEGGVVEDFEQGFGERGAIADGKRQSVFHVAYEFGVCGDVADDAGQALLHRFHKAVGHALEFAGKDKCIQSGQERCSVGPVTGENNFGAAVESVCERLKCCSCWSVADQYEPGVAANLMQELKGPDEVTQALLWSKPAHKADYWGVLRQFEEFAGFGATGKRAGGRGSVGNQVESFGREAECAVEIKDACRIADEGVGAVSEAAVDFELPAAFP